MDVLLTALFILFLPVILIAIGLWQDPSGAVWIYRLLRDESGSPRALMITGIFLILAAVVGALVWMTGWMKF